MFTVTLHYDQCPTLAPWVYGTRETYAEAYTLARDVAASQAIRGSQYTKVVHDDETGLDVVEARQMSYSALHADALLAHAVITCDDLDAWHAAIEGGADMWTWKAPAPTPDPDDDPTGDLTVVGVDEQNDLVYVREPETKRMVWTRMDRYGQGERVNVTVEGTRGGWTLVRDEAGKTHRVRPHNLAHR